MLNMCEKNACTACVSFSPNPSPADAAKSLAGVLPSGAGTAPTDFRYIIRSTYPDAPQCVPPLVCTAVDELGNAAYIRYDELMRMVRPEELRRLLLVHVVQNSSGASFTQTVAATIISTSCWGKPCLMRIVIEASKHSLSVTLLSVTLLSVCHSHTTVCHTTVLVRAGDRLLQR
jgi:hypothetical protein